MIRKILGVLAGYALFVVSSVILFKMAGQDPHGEASDNFQRITAVYGIFFSFLSGFILQSIAKTHPLYLNYVLAFIIAAFAIFSLAKTGGTHWTQWLAIIVFAPTSILGGLFYIWRMKK